MSDEVVKKLLDSLSQEQKQELIQEILNSNVKSDPPSPEEKPVARASSLPEGMTEIKKRKTQGQITGVPVTDMPRFNKFKDDGSEHADDITPDVQLTERKRRPFQKIEQRCTRCNKTFSTHPQHQREFYVCDKCLRR
jgi:hypothetical protein